jgi:hypothetical protein
MAFIPCGQCEEDCADTMNERIRELAEQADLVKILDEHASEYGNGMFENTPYPELEKFAELIVRECMNVLDPGEHQLIARFQARKWLAEHFGVEE